MIARYYRPLAFLLLVSLVGCSSLPFGLGDILQPASSTPASSPSIPAYPTSTAIGTPLPVETPHGGATQPPGEVTIHLWLPPQFDPNGNSAASKLLNARLAEFKAENRAASLEIRVKAVDGPGGMLDDLVAASVAAPAALPDLVLLPRVQLESAVVKGLLYPYDGLTSIMDDGSWFEYALQLSHPKDRTYSIPFAGDVMILAHTLPAGQAMPLSLADVLSEKKPLLFPAADPQALFTLCMYLAEGGKLQDDQGRPALDETQLVNLLEYDQQARLAGVMPYTLTQFTDDSQVWEALLGGQYPLAVTWASTFLSDPRAAQAGLRISPLPTPDGAPFSLASGWGWALSGQDLSARQLGVRLVEFLVEREFLAQWTQAAGYLPPRGDALQTWPASPSRHVLEQVSNSAWLVPSPDLTATIGPVLQQAVMAVLESRRDAQGAAKAAINQISRP